MINCIIVFFTWLIFTTIAVVISELFHNALLALLLGFVLGGVGMGIGMYLSDLYDSYKYRLR